MLGCRYNTLVFCIVIALTSLRCHTNTVEPSRNSSPTNLANVIPLKTGNTWIYREINCYADTCDTTMDTVRIIGTVPTTQGVCFRYQGIMPSFEPSGFFFAAKVDSAAFSLYMSSGNSSRISSSYGDTIGVLSFCMLRLPLKKGNEWPCAAWDSSNMWGWGTVTITDTNEIVRLGNGITYHGIHLENPIGNSAVIVPGVGVVGAAEGFLESSDRFELVTWDLH